MGAKSVPSETTEWATTHNNGRRRDMLACMVLDIVLKRAPQCATDALISGPSFLFFPPFLIDSWSQQETVTK